MLASTVGHKVLPYLAQTLQLVPRNHAVTVFVAFRVIQLEDLEYGGCVLSSDGGEGAFLVVSFVEICYESLLDQRIGDLNDVTETKWHQLYSWPLMPLASTRLASPVMVCEVVQRARPTASSKARPNILNIIGI
jgi:hypothetical protein